MPDWLKTYHNLPYPARTIIASMRGYQLRWWRYGRETDTLVDEAIEREHWNEAKWRAWRDERLAFILHRAATQVPYYREYWSERRRGGDKRTWEVLENWPILKKEILRQNNPAFLAEDCNPRRMFPDHTSGTSGTPLTIWLNRQTVMDWYALFERRWRGWYGVSRFDRWGILGGQLVTPVTQADPPFWVWNQGLNQLYLSSYHLSANNITHYLKAIEQYKLIYLWGYTSSLYSLAHEALRLGNIIPMRVVITNAEPLYDYQRNKIEEAFDCPVYETYGLSEAVVAASECAFHKLHLWPETGVVEVFNQNDKVDDGQAGDLICTGLFNADMPLIRYRVGDRGSMAKEQGDCRCGRSLPRLARVEGRADDILITRDGRRIGRLDPVFKADMPIVEAQIIQESLDTVRIKFVPAEGYTVDIGEMLAERLRDRMGQVEVVLESVDQIPRTAGGKFRAVVSHVHETK